MGHIKMTARKVLRRTKAHSGRRKQNEPTVAEEMKEMRNDPNWIYHNVKVEAICPYAQDIHNENKICNCTEYSREQCRQDI